jgi:ribosomal protein S18 acetylase RimI-like enzyme
MNPLSIRRLATDAEAKACAGFMAASEPWTTLGRGAPMLLEMLRDPGREPYVVHAGEDLAGCLVLNLHGPFVGYIQAICVAPRCRGRGVGSALMAFAEARIFREHPNVFLCVSSFNPSARRLYERLGYHVVGELTDFVVQGYSEFLMRKTIGPLDPARRPPG